MTTDGPRPQTNMRESLRRACDRLAGQEPEQIAHRSGATARSDGTLALHVLTAEVVIDACRASVADRDGQVVSEYYAAPLARYLLADSTRCGRGAPETGFADHPDARTYAGPFSGRVIAPLVGRFGNDPDGFRSAAEATGGSPVPEHDTDTSVACRFQVFPHLALAFVLEPGDEEFPASGQMLFPEGVFDAFAVDDVVAFADLLSRALRRRLPGALQGS